MSDTNHARTHRLRGSTPLRHCACDDPACTRVRRTWREHWISGPCLQKLEDQRVNGESLRDFRRRLMGG